MSAYLTYSARGAGSGGGVTSLNSLTGALTLSAGSNITITDNGSNTITITGNGAGDVTLAAVGSSPNANGASLSGQVLTLQPANTSFPGVLLAADWNTFNNKQSTITIGALDAQAVNSTGLALVSNVLSAQSADATHPGMVNIAAQSFAGKKTFINGLDANSNKITSVTDPTSAQDAATKNYVDTQLTGLNPQEAVVAASTANIPSVYVNGASGVGATLTVVATGALSVDDVAVSSGNRVLIKNQTSGLENGIYVVTNPGSLGVSAILTRASNYNTAAEMNASGLIPVLSGTVNALTSWDQTATITTVGTDSLVFAQFTASPSNFLLKTNNLSDVSNTATSFNNLSPMTSAGDIIIGGASGAGTRLAIGSTNKVLTVIAGAPSWQTLNAITALTGDATASGPGSAALTLATVNSNVGSFTNASIIVNAKGLVTAASSGTAPVTSLSVNSTNGFTGTFSASTTPVLTLQTSISGILKGSSNAMVPATLGTDYSGGTSALATGILKSTTTTGALTIAVAGDFPTLNQNTTGTASNVTGTVAIANGGTGQTTKAAAFDALSPMTTGGDLIYGGASGTGTRLANGTAGQYLQSQGTTVAPIWAAAPSGQLVIGTPVTTNQTTASTSYANTTTNIAVTITATATTNYKIFCNFPMANDTDGNVTYAKIVATSGSPTVLHTSPALQLFNGSGYFRDSYTYTIVTLTSGNTYTFNLQWRVGGGTGTINAAVYNTEGGNGVALIATQL